MVGDKRGDGNRDGAADVHGEEDDDVGSDDSGVEFSDGGEDPKAACKGEGGGDVVVDGLFDDADCDKEVGEEDGCGEADANENEDDFPFTIPGKS